MPLDAALFGTPRSAAKPIKRNSMGSLSKGIAAFTVIVFPPVEYAKPRQSSSTVTSAVPMGGSVSSSRISPSSWAKDSSSRSSSEAA